MEYILLTNIFKLVLIFNQELSLDLVAMVSKWLLVRCSSIFLAPRHSLDYGGNQKLSLSANLKAGRQASD